MGFAVALVANGYQSIWIVEGSPAGIHAVMHFRDRAVTAQLADTATAAYGTISNGQKRRMAQVIGVAAIRRCRPHCFPTVTSSPMRRASISAPASESTGNNFSPTFPRPLILMCG